MHAALNFVVYWAVAFVSLGMAVVLLNIYFGWIGNDLELRSAGREAAMSGLASLVEAAGLWLIVSFVPGAPRALIVPAMIAGLIYKLGHLEDWSRYDVFMLLAFQIVIALVGISLVYGRFEAGIFCLIGFGIFLAVLAAFARSFL
jgi:hypothetical protein